MYTPYTGEALRSLEIGPASCLQQLVHQAPRLGISSHSLVALPQQIQQGTPPQLLLCSLGSNGSQQLQGGQRRLAVVPQGLQCNMDQLLSASEVARCHHGCIVEVQAVNLTPYAGVRCLQGSNREWAADSACCRIKLDGCYCELVQHTGAG